MILLLNWTERSECVHQERIHHMALNGGEKMIVMKNLNESRQIVSGFRTVPCIFRKDSGYSTWCRTALESKNGLHICYSQ